MEKKLTLKKIEIASLNEQEQAQVLGGDKVVIYIPPSNIASCVSACHPCEQR